MGLHLQQTRADVGFYEAWWMNYFDIPEFSVVLRNDTMICLGWMDHSQSY